MGRRPASLRSVAKKAFIFLMVSWIAVPALAVVVFLSWASLTAEWPWRALFLAMLAGVVLLGYRWARLLLEQRAAGRTGGAAD